MTGISTSAQPAETRGRTFLQDLRDLWVAIPRKGFFGVLLISWAALFHFLGNPTFGYVNTPSLFGWMANAYNAPASEDGHGSLIPLAVLALLWVRRAEWRHCLREATWSAFPLVVLGLLLHLVGYVVQQPRISIVGLFAGFYGLAGITWGWAFLRAIFFPYFLFVFCVPLGSLAESVTFPLRLLVTKLAVGISNGVLGVDVVRDGTLIYDSQRTFMYDVAPACSGIRSLVALVALTTIYSWLTFRAAWRRAAIILSSLPLAVIGNVLRLLTVIVVAEAFGQQAGAAIEQKFGFVTFGVAIGGALLLGHWLRESPVRTSAAPADRSSALAASPSRSLVPLGIATVVLIGGVALFLGRLHSFQKLGAPGVRLSATPALGLEGKVASTNRVELPERVLDYTSQLVPISDAEIDSLPKDTTYGRRLYTSVRNGQTNVLLLQVVLMGTDRTSIHRPEFCLTGQGWNILSSTVEPLPLQKPHPTELPVVKMTASARFTLPDGRVADQRGVYVFWFVADGKVTASHGERMWWMARDLMMRRTLGRWAYVACWAVCPPGEEAPAYERMREFISAAVPEFQTSFPSPVGIQRAD